MSRTILPFHADDISAVAKSLRAQLGELGHPPGHVEMLSMLARAAGFRNFQHLRADAAARGRLDAAPPPEAPVDHAQVERLLRCFDGAGRLARWPAKLSQQVPCLWVLWSRLPPRQTLTERAVNDLLRDLHLFGDHALLRRELCNHGLAIRSTDCSAYRRVERRPPPDAAALIRRLEARRAA
ncbi:MAG TPA: DUF2087 domain-containing protein [Azospirillaceae bacterium]|nr:DUF2087 domain-containing protein [Azospirillaceae bacterium]